MSTSKQGGVETSSLHAGGVKKIQHLVIMHTLTKEGGLEVTNVAHRKCAYPSNRICNLMRSRVS